MLQNTFSNTSISELESCAQEAVFSKVKERSYISDTEYKAVKGKWPPVAEILIDLHGEL